MNSINSRRLHCVALGALVLITAGCSSTIPPPQGDQTLRRIYDAHAAAQTSAQPTLQRPGGQAVWSDYTRTVATETDVLFPRLPNPTLFLYISPHRAGHEGFPIPGYTIPVTLYERSHYALPGERTDAH